MKNMIYEKYDIFMYILRLNVYFTENFTQNNKFNINPRIIFTRNIFKGYFKCFQINRKMYVCM